MVASAKRINSYEESTSSLTEMTDDLNAELKASSPTNSDFLPSNDVWYYDGGILLVAENTAFRVHGAVIAEQCEVFRDMFSVPQSPTADAAQAETRDGCRVLRLQDSAADLKHFLKSIYDISYFLPGVTTKFPIVASVLRLSTKYNAPVLRQRAINLIATAYPSSCAAWDARSTKRLVPPFEDEHFAYIELAIKTDVRVILPSVYYALTRLPLAKALGGLRSLAVSPADQWDVCTNFLVGRELTTQAELMHVVKFLKTDFSRPGCKDSRHCGNMLHVAAFHTLNHVADTVPYHHQWCGGKLEEGVTTIGLCASCNLTVKDTINSGREKVWEVLPASFGLGDWETLKAVDGVDVQEIGPQ
ncbi:uncharacterized protein FIBRA_02634 [Fibroporia radiculosa]|uniref:BTB domain-containing protein n=1 Tax=Fibroporia radiculosa TaxID=599839 RepID=J4G243_9APHY|nr:uncharacterized protein FIBRA_02634 [Fibroporia radiculosa]CCM00598.1 predicted protein [Fibroporia radiculosa]